MAKRLYEHECETGHITEAFVDYEQRTVLCDCGLEANRIISPVRISLDGTDPNFTSAYDKWARVREEKTKQEVKRNAA